MTSRRRLLPSLLLLVGLSLPAGAASAADAAPLLPYEPLDGVLAAPPAASAAPALAMAQDFGHGVASYYGRSFAGRRTASGETFDPEQLTAAHRTLPFGSLVRVTKPDSGRSVVVRINDRGPFGRGRLIDVSEAAARELGLIGPGHAPVRLSLLPADAAEAEAPAAPQP